MELPRLLSALPTPFDANNFVDFDSTKNLITYQIQNGVKGIVVAGSTGEGHVLKLEEWKTLVEFTVNNFKNKVFICVGTGFNSTEQSIEYSMLAEKMGADAIMCVVPYYNKPQQDGIYSHFAKIANSVNLPIILYNVPGRTVTDMSNETIIRLVKDFRNIIALKDATGDLSRVTNLRIMLEEHNINNFRILSGEDATQIGFNAMGGTGLISVAANIAPKIFAKIQALCEQNLYNEAIKEQNVAVKIANAMFCEVNPVPVKYALYKAGIFRCATPRLPLIELSDKNKLIIDNMLALCN